MDLSSFLSSLGGGASVLGLSLWVFNRLVDRVDELANKIQEIDKIVARREDKLNDIDDHAESISDVKERLGILEAQSKPRYNGLG